MGRLGTTLARGIGVLAFAGLAACSSTLAPTPSAAGPSTGAGLTASAPVETPTVAPSVSASLAPCGAADLRATAVGQGETGSVNIEVDITNVGTDACALPGVPLAVSLLTGDGKALDVVTLPPASDPPMIAVARPGIRADAVLIVYWSSWCLPTPGPISIAVKLSQATTIRVAVLGSLLPRCDTPGRQSMLQIDSLVGEAG